MSIVAQLRNALEFARFSSPEIRDATADCIKILSADLDEVEYDCAVNVTIAFKTLNDAITNFENSDADTSTPVITREDKEIDKHEEKELVFDISDEVDRVLSAPSKSNTDIDDEDID